AEAENGQVEVQEVGKVARGAREVRNTGREKNSRPALDFWRRACDRAGAIFPLYHALSLLSIGNLHKILILQIPIFV
ncbi:MAG: hypothetical protein IJZ27_02790, partial [Treponema sp.]|nr:hypothetical protein [Treponema sp.]